MNDNVENIGMPTNTTNVPKNNMNNIGLPLKAPKIVASNENILPTPKLPVVTLVILKRLLHASEKLNISV